MYTRRETTHAFAFEIGILAERCPTSGTGGGCGLDCRGKERKRSKDELEGEHIVVMRV